MIGTGLCSIISSMEILRACEHPNSSPSYRIVNEGLYGPGDVDGIDGLGEGGPTVDEGGRTRLSTCISVQTSAIVRGMELTRKIMAWRSKMYSGSYLLYSTSIHSLTHYFFCCLALPSMCMYTTIFYTLNILDVVYSCSSPRLF